MRNERKGNIKLGEAEVHEYFELYRAGKRFLKQEFVEHGEPVKAKQGYEFAPDPRLMRHQRVVYSSAPRGWSDRNELEERQQEWHPFLQRMRDMVKRLPRQCQRDLIAFKLMTKDPPPDDKEVWKLLCKMGWLLSFQDYQSTKEEVILFLAKQLPRYFPKSEL